MHGEKRCHPFSFMTLIASSGLRTIERFRPVTSRRSGRVHQDVPLRLSIPSAMLLLHVFQCMPMISSDPDPSNYHPQELASFGSLVRATPHDVIPCRLTQSVHHSQADAAFVYSLHQDNIHAVAIESAQCRKDTGCDAARIRCRPHLLSFERPARRIFEAGYTLSAATPTAFPSDTSLTISSLSLDTRASKSPSNSTTGARGR